MNKPYIPARIEQVDGIRYNYVSQGEHSGYWYIEIPSGLYRWARVNYPVGNNCGDGRIFPSDPNPTNLDEATALSCRFEVWHRVDETIAILLAKEKPQPASQG